MTEVIEALKQQVDARWRHFGTFLHFDPALMDTIDKDNKGSTDCMLDLVTRWLSEEDGTGQLPRTGRQWWRQWKVQDVKNLQWN